MDVELFHLINHTIANDFLDWLAPILRDKHTWIPVYVLLLIYIVLKFKKQSFVIILCGILAGGLADSISSKVIKPMVQRIRPCNESIMQPEVKNIVGCGSGYSFPSSHASNHFALSVFLALAVWPTNRIMRTLLLFWAVSIAFSQVYVGVHYPLDVTCGAILGTVIGGISFWLSMRFLVILNRNKVDA
jgi:membrane-associated phospholipid phosphatase